MAERRWSDACAEPGRVNGATAPNGQGSASAPRPYRKGWRAPWRGRWGPLSDGNSRLARRARQIERELRQEYLIIAPLHVRLVRVAARYAALAEMTLSTLGDDPKSTRRACTALQAAADRQLAKLDAAGVRRSSAPATLAEQLSRAGR